MVFDDGFHTLAIYYTASDNLSGIHRLEFGLGRTKYDVMVRKYLPFDLRGNGQQTYLLNEEFHMSSGVPAWIRLKVVDQGRVFQAIFYDYVANTAVVLKFH